MGALRELAKTDPDASLPVTDLISALLATLIVKSDGDSLRPDEVAQLAGTERERLVAAIIAGNADWFDAGGDGVPREIDENDEHYLTRAYRDQATRSSVTCASTKSRPGTSPRP